MTNAKGISTVSLQSRASTTEETSFQGIAERCVHQTHAFAVWQSPGETIQHFIVDPTGNNYCPDAPLEDLPPGFLFSPFDRSAARYFVKAVHHFTSADSLSEVKQNLFPEIPDSAGTHEKWYAGQVSVPQTDNYAQHIHAAIQAIEAGVFQKVVLSRSRKAELSATFNLFRSFRELCMANPTALVSLVAIPGIGTWLGASPETLVRVDANNIFSTVAMAGTQRYEPGTELKKVAWTQKEIEEQAYVSRYIINCFKKIRLREFDEVGPRTAVAGNLLHLKTDYTVDMTATHFLQLGSVMLDLLHPTSAVCGMPMEAALEFIRKTEPHRRSFYSGYLGPVKIRDPIQIHVNLRCLQLTQGSAVLYAGAGITIDSDPEREYQETEIKMEALLKLL